MEQFGFYKKVEIKDADHKYGFKQKGVFALEKIYKGERIFKCDIRTCDYLPHESLATQKTRDYLLKIIQDNSECKGFICRYVYMADDDVFDWPKHWKEQLLTCECMFFNHSCDGNTGYGHVDTGTVVAKRDIEPGEELTYDYQLMDSETSFYAGINCKCGTAKCRGILKFDHYRNIDWIKENYKYSSTLIKKRIYDLTKRWFSASCYLKRDKNDKLHLTSFKKILKNELVAIYSNQSSINQESHYLWNSNNPTCYVNADGEVYAKEIIEPETELTLEFH